MAKGFTTFLTYKLISISGSTTGYGYNDAIHCNYTHSMVLDTIINKEINISFNSVNEFQFLLTNGNGFSAHNIEILVQVIDNTSYLNLSDVKPISTDWRIYDVTDQVRNYVSGKPLTGVDLVATVFKIPLAEYNTKPIYNLTYLNYSIATDTTLNLNLGEEEFFFGNVNTDIEAIAYSMDLAIKLPLGEFNSTTNLTWDSVSKVNITEIGIYDNNKNLVAIGKLNNPIPKDSTISRTILFGIDF